MGSNFNFRNFGNEPPGDSGGGMNRQSLTRQGSIYSLTFDEFQSSLGKEFGSMNMDELLKNIWSAEETQAMGSTSGAGGVSGAGAGCSNGQEGLQRQGSLTLPRTLSQKTVDEVWKDISKEYTPGNDKNNGNNGSSVPQNQPTLGEITLEEFLVRAGVVREDAEVNKAGFFCNTSRSAGNNSELGTGFLQASRMSGLIGNLGPDTVNHMQMQNSTLPLNVNGARSSNQQQQPPPIVPKQPGFSYGTQMGLQSGQMNNHGIRGGLMGLGDQCIVNNGGLVQGNGLMGGGGLGIQGAMAISTASPVTPLSSDGIGKSNGDSSSVSPSPYMFKGGVRGRKGSGAVEKVVERRQRRMIKNRESAARSRARKQAYTMELEAEIAKLKEQNEELHRKQAEMLEIQKKQEMEMMSLQGGPRKRLRRTQTGPW